MRCLAAAAAMARPQPAYRVVRADFLDDDDDDDGPLRGLGDADDADADGACRGPKAVTRAVCV